MISFDIYLLSNNGWKSVELIGLKKEGIESFNVNDKVKQAVVGTGAELRRETNLKCSNGNKQKG